MNLEQILSLTSVGVAVAALVASSVLLVRQTRHMEAERNASTVLEAVKRITDPAMVEVFTRLRGIDERYPTDDAICSRYPGSQDERDMQAVSAYIGTVACLARRGVIDASLLADALGYGVRLRWSIVRDFVQRQRRVLDNPYIAEHFEWLAMYSAWWKDVPRPKSDRNFASEQFAGVEFRV